jgi:anti-sigma regulatory factor (Ser/Thr protein kinase)/PAS domain-containing protein
MILFLFSAVPVFSAETLVLSGGDYYKTGRHLEILEDSSGLLTIDDVSSREFSGKFRVSDDEVPNFGYTSSAWWLRVTLNDQSPDVKRLIELDYALVDDFRLYTPLPEGGFTEKKSGRKYPFSLKEVKSRTYVFSLDVIKNSDQTLYIRLESADSLPAPLIVWEYGAFIEHNHREQFYLGLYYGLIVVMALFNIFIFFSTRDINYVYYVLTIIFLFGLFQMGINGLFFEYPGFDSLWWSRTSIAFFFSIGVVTALQFCRSFLNTKTSMPLLHKFMNLIIIWGLGEAVMSFFVDYHIVIQSSVIMGQFCVGSLWVASFISLRKGNRSVIIFLSAWSLLLAGGGMYSLKVWGLLPSNFITEYSWQIGSAVETVLLAIALGDMLNIMRREKNRAHARAMNALREADLQKDEFLAHITDKNRNIEKLNAELEKRLEAIDAANKKISMSEEKYRFLVEGTGDIIFSMDENFRILTINKAVKTHFNIRPDALISRGLLELIYENPYDNLVAKQFVQNKLDDFLADGKPVDFRAEFRSSILAEPKEMLVALEHMNTEGGGRREFLGKVTPIQDDSLIKYFIGENQQFGIENYLMTAEELSRRVTRNLVKYIDSKEASLMRIAIREILCNAIEHGNLNISYEEKSDAMFNDRYFEFIAERKNDDRYRNRRVELVYSLDKEKAVYTITDEGEGFDYTAYLENDLSELNENLQLHGRGLAMSKSIFDKMEFNEKGNQITLTKHLGENSSF